MAGESSSRRAVLSTKGAAPEWRADCIVGEPEGTVKALLVLLVCVATFGAVDTSAHETLSIRCNPSVGMAPATILVTVTVEPNAANRDLTIEADSTDYFTSSVVTLDGDKAAKFQGFTLKGVPAGEYELYAWVNKDRPGASRTMTHYSVRE